MNHGCSLTDLSFASSGTQETPKETPKSKLKLPGKRQSKGGKARLQTSDVRPSSDIGRPTQFGRPTSKGTKEATEDRSSASDVGHPTDFGRPKCRTSDRQRTSEIPMTESLQMPRTYGGLRTSDTSDVRNPTDVRHLLLQIARPLPDPTDTTTFGRPNPVGRPKPACVQRQLGHGPCIPLLSPRL